jgi:hypothetical protein
MSWQAWDFGASGLTLIDGANILTGTILANSIKSKSIGANQIAAGAIDTSLLTFTPVTSGTGGATDLAKQVVAAINSDQEGGLKISATKLTLTGLLQVGGAAADINSGATLISGGKIQTNSIDAAAIKAGAITTDKLTVGTVQRTSLLVNGHFGTYNTFGNSAAGWTLDPAVYFVSQYGTYTPVGSTVALKVPSLQVNPGGGKVIAQQVVTVIPGRQYTLVGMLYHSGGTAGIRVFTAKGSGDYELSSGTNTGTPAGSIVPAFYQNATYINNGAAASSVINRWNLYGYRVTIPTDVTQVAIQIYGWNTATTDHYPGFIQFYDDNLNEATASLDMVNQLQNVAFGGDVAGNYAAITVNRINNRNVSPAAPNNGNVLTWNSTSSWWEPNNMSGIFGYTPANKTGDTFTGAVVLNTGAFPSASTGASTVTLVGGLGSPWAGKIYFGDGTGWKYAFSRRSSSADTDVLTIQDNGNITSLGSISATSGTFSSTITGASFNGITGLASVAPLMNGTAAVGTSTLTARQDHVHPIDTSRQAALNGTGLVRMTGTTVSYDNSTYLTGTKVDSFNSRTGVVTLTSSDVTTALNYTPINKAGDTGIGNLSMSALAATTGTFSAGISAPNAVTGGASNSQWGKCTTNLSDFNQGLPSGFYDGLNATGNIPGTNWNYIINSAHYGSCSGNQYQLQIAADFWDKEIYFRKITPSTLTPAWTRYITSANLGSTGLAIGGTTGTFSGVLTTNGGMNMGRSNSASTGILYYSTTYTAWQTYMSPPGVASGVSGTVVAPTGTYVTDWGFRIFIENRPGFGWTWESGTQTSTTPSIVAELSSVTGNFRTIGSISATAGIFSGAVSQTPVAFASLPAGSAGMRAFVNNNSAGAAFGSTANGAGSTTYPVYHDGVSWKVG